VCHGNAASFTAGPGVEINGGTLSNTGVLTLAVTGGASASASAGNVTLDAAASYGDPDYIHARATNQEPAQDTGIRISGMVRMGSETGTSEGPQYSLNPNGAFTYTHNGSETTSDSFTYQVSDGIALSNIATVTITITPVNDNPTANGDAFLAIGNTELRVGTGAAAHPAAVVSGSVLANDADGDGPGPLTVTAFDATSANGDRVDVRINPASGDVMAEKLVSDLSENDVKAKLTAAGYSKIHDVDFDDGVWKAEAERADGNDVEIHLAANTGEIIHVEND
jgi:VCBS repeat-containing protein